MQHNRIFALTLLATGILSTPALANTPESSHRMGGNLFWGALNVADPELEQDSKAADVTGYNLFYRYQWEPRFGVELAYRYGSTGPASGIANIFWGELEDMDYRAISISGYAGYSITQQQQLYAKLGISQNKVAMQYRTRRFSETEFGFIAAVGWQYQFTNGLGFQTEASYSSGKYFKSFGTLLFGLNYRF